MPLIGCSTISTSSSSSTASYSDLFKKSNFNGTKNVTETIVIKKAGTYDFKNVLHIWKGKSWGCTADKEHGPQILRIEASDVIVKNFSYIGDGTTHGSNGLGDPIHIASCGTGQGNKCPTPGPSNLTIEKLYGHACEDMITIGTPKSSDIIIKGSTIIANPKKSTWDKTIQVNFGKNINITDNTFIGGSQAIRFKPRTTGAVEKNVFKNVSTAVGMSSNDSDIEPMKNGTTTVIFSENNYYGAKVRCNGKTISGTGKINCN